MIAKLMFHKLLIIEQILHVIDKNREKVKLKSLAFSFKLTI
jgi:hypothetical protein